MNDNEKNLEKPTYEELVGALKETHNLYIEAIGRNNYMTHDITRVMSNDYIFRKLGLIPENNLNSNDNSL